MKIKLCHHLEIKHKTLHCVIGGKKEIYTTDFNNPKEKKTTQPNNNSTKKKQTNKHKQTSWINKFHPRTFPLSLFC